MVGREGDQKAPEHSFKRMTPPTLHRNSKSREQDAYLAQVEAALSSSLSSGALSAPLSAGPWRAVCGKGRGRAEGRSEGARAPACRAGVRGDLGPTPFTRGVAEGSSPCGPRAWKRVPAPGWASSPEHSDFPVCCTEGVQPGRFKMGWQNTLHSGLRLNSASSKEHPLPTPGTPSPDPELLGPEA